MAAFSQSETTTTRRTFTLGTPAAYVELYKMLYAAEAQFKHFHGLADQTELRDDALTVEVGDDEVLVFFDYPGTARKQANA